MSSNILLTCPECNAEMHVPETVLTKRGQCHACGHIGTIELVPTKSAEEPRRATLALPPEPEPEPEPEPVPKSPPPLPEKPTDNAPKTPKPNNDRIISLAIIAFALVLALGLLVWIGWKADRGQETQTAERSPAPNSAPAEPQHWDTPEDFMRHIIDLLGDPIDKSSAGASFAAALATAGHRDEAKEAFAAAKESAEGISDNKQAAVTLRMIAQFQSTAGFLDEEVHTLQKTLEVLDRDDLGAPFANEEERKVIEEEKKRRKSELAGDFVRAADLVRGLSLVEELADPAVRTRGYIAIASELIAQGKPLAAGPMLKLALQESQRIPPRGNISVATMTAEIAINYARKGKTRQALIIVGEIDKAPGIQVNAYRAIAVEMIRNGKEAARETLDKLPIDLQLDVRCEQAALRLDGRSKEAAKEELEDIRNNCKDLPSHKSVAILRKVARHMDRLGEKETAIEILEDSLLHKPANQTTTFTLAEMYWDGRNEEALRQLAEITEEVFSRDKPQQQLLRFLNLSAQMLAAECDNCARHILQVMRDDGSQLIDDMPPAQRAHLARLEAATGQIGHSLKTAKGIPGEMGANALAYIAILHAVKRGNAAPLNYYNSLNLQNQNRGEPRLMKIQGYPIKDSFDPAARQIAMELCKAMEANIGAPSTNTEPEVNLEPEADQDSEEASTTPPSAANQGGP